MASINFYLRNELKDSFGNCPVFLVFQEKGKKFKHFTGIKIKPQEWSKTEQLAILGENVEASTNRKLNQQKRHLRTVYLHHSAKGEYQLADIKLAFKKSILKYEDACEVLDCLHLFLRDHREKRKPGTLIVYQTFANDFKAFIKKQSKLVDFEDLTPEKVQEFAEFLRTERKNNNNTIQKKIKTLKTFLRYASSRGKVEYKLIENLKKVKVKRSKTVKVFLTEKELSKVFNLNLARYPDLKLSRDLFLFSCFTGLSFTDIQKLKPTELENGKINLQLPTGRTLRIPLNNYATMLLQRYENHSDNCFPSVANVYANKHIKAIGKLAGINEEISALPSTSDMLEMKYNLLTTNSGRLTYAYLSLKSGMPPQFLMELVGTQNVNELLQKTLDSDLWHEVEIVECWNKKVF